MLVSAREPRLWMGPLRPYRAWPFGMAIRLPLLLAWTNGRSDAKLRYYNAEPSPHLLVGHRVLLRVGMRKLHLSLEQFRSQFLVTGQIPSPLLHPLHGVTREQPPYISNLDHVLPDPRAECPCNPPPYMLTTQSSFSLNTLHEARFTDQRPENLIVLDIPCRCHSLLNSRPKISIPENPAEAS